jgi:cytochrome b561
MHVMTGTVIACARDDATLPRRHDRHDGRLKMHANTRYDRFSIMLHWCMTILILTQLALGLWMLGLPKDGSGLRAAWFNVHKSLGIVLLLLALLRIAWLPWRPRVAPAARGWQQAAARTVHALLYACMCIVPLSGLLGSLFSPYPVRFFGLVLPRLLAPWEAGKVVAGAVHQASAWVLMTLVIVHLLAFVWHQFVRRDGLLARMHPRA